jgi:hypothetical protein
MGRSPQRVRHSNGAQTVDRACLLLEGIARSGSPGARLVDLTQRPKLNRATVHRILQSLSEEEWVRTMEAKGLPAKQELLKKYDPPVS